jgi:hypothetical protein
MGVERGHPEGGYKPDGKVAGRCRRRSSQESEEKEQSKTFVRVNLHGRCACSGCPRRTDGAPKRSSFKVAVLAAPSVRVTTDAPEATVAAFECNGLGLQNLPTRSQSNGSDGRSSKQARAETSMAYVQLASAGL